MRVPPTARNALFVLGMVLLAGNHAYANTATVAAQVTPATGQGIQVINGVRVAVGATVAGGYALLNGTVAGVAGLGNVGIAVGARIAAGAAVAVAATATVGPLVLGGLALGAGAAAAKNWLDDAHAAGKAGDYEYDPTSQKIQKKAPAAGAGAMDPDRTVTDNGQTAAERFSGSGANCGANCQGWKQRNGNHCGSGPSGGWYTIALINYYGNEVTGYCVPPGGMVPLTSGPPTTPTADEWEALAAELSTIPVNPKILEQMGKPIPVDPVPVINPPDQTGAADVEIGASNPAPNLQSRPQTIVGQAVPISNTSPQQYEQTTHTITPANTAADPFAVTVTSVTTTTGNPATPTNPTTPIPGTATPSTPDVCAQNPNAAMCQPVGTITDPSMPPIPELYVRKYPQGLAGIWQDKTAALTQTSLVTVLYQMMPTGITGGTCPSWTLNLSFGPDWADLGTHEVAPPCWLWDVAKAIMIISALMLARQLIFGG